MSADQFNALYENHRSAIFARCCRLLDDRSAAEDASQEIFLRVHRHIGSAPANDEALRWMFRITTNYCLNMLRDRKLRPAPTDDYAHVVGVACPEERIADRDLGRRLTMRAPAHLRAVAWLYHVEGLAQHEIANELGISRRTVVNYLSAFNEYAERFPGAGRQPGQQVRAAGSEKEACSAGVRRARSTSRAAAPPQVAVS